MFKRSVLLFNVFVGMTLLLSACGQAATSSTPTSSYNPSKISDPVSSSDLSSQLQTADTFYDGFPDFGHMLAPTDYDEKYGDTIPIFRLSQDFPKSEPPKKDLPPMLEINFETDWEDYALSVRDYCFDGNVGNSNIEEDWRPEDNTVRDWYHIPWLHWGPTGTEGFHGLIFETSVSPFQLATEQVDSQYIYAVTIMNAYGGYTMGQMWDDPLKPNRMATDKREDGGFPVGTVFCKLLFTTAPTEQVDYLTNPIEWTAYILANPEVVYSDPDELTREVGTVRLLQMDWMVRDDDSKDTGWVLGTFVYNGNLKNERLWDNLVPLGVQWGNDPDITKNEITPYPARKTEINSDLKQTIINPSDDVPPQHLGWNGRLNGPADLNTSSCMACHGVAEFPQITSLVAPGMVPATGAQPSQLPPTQGGSEEWMIWFKNYEAATAIDEKYSTSTDFSLQVAISLANFYEWSSQQVGGEWASEYEQVAQPLDRGGKGDK